MRARVPESQAELDALLQRIADMDRRARGGPGAQRILSLIEAHPAQLAATLARRCSMDTQPFKVRVRKLKELGLTESLEVGYRLSLRGQRVLDAMREAAPGT